MKRVFTAALLSFLVMGFCLADTPNTSTDLPTIENPNFSRAVSYPVERIVDGDTFSVKIDGKSVTVRMIGVDTPETVHPSKPVQAYGKEASRFTTNLLTGERVFLLYEGDRPEKDKYGRTLAYAYRAPDGLFVNAEIIRQGYGHVYTVYPFKHLEQFRELAQFAMNKKKGLWGSTGTGGTATRPVTIRPAKTPRVVATPPPVNPRDDGENQTVYRTRTGAKYHAGGCRHLRKSSIALTLKQAKAMGYGPCSVCGPPTE